MLGLGVIKFMVIVQFGIRVRVRVRFNRVILTARVMVSRLLF